MPEKTALTVTCALIAGPVLTDAEHSRVADSSGEGGLAVGSHVLVVRDHGTGLGVELAGTLGLVDDDAAEVLALASLAGLATKPGCPQIEVVLRSADDDADVLVEVTGPGDHHSVEQRWPRVSLVDRVLGMLTQARLDAHSAWPHLHGGALVDGEERAVLVLGRSGAGKSTLVANLAATGLHLVNDEQVSLHPAHGLVAGFTRPIAVKPGGERHLPPEVTGGLASRAYTQLVGAAALGSRHRLVGRPALLVFPERGDDHPEVAWEQLSAVEAIEALSANNLDMARSPSTVLAAFAWLATTIPAVTIRYREVTDAIPVVERLLADPPALDPVVWTLSEAAAPEDQAVPNRGPVVCASEGVMTLGLGAETMLFNPARLQLLRLNSTGAELWATLPWPDLPVEDAELSSVVEFAFDLADQGLVDLFGDSATIYERAPSLGWDTDHPMASLAGAEAAVWDALAAPGRPHELVRRIMSDGDASAVDADRRSVAHQVNKAIAALMADGIIVQQ